METGMGSRAGMFLSCLLGSEAAVPVHPSERSFLSCLLGSEVIDEMYVSTSTFLSCLLGSEVPR